MKIRQHLYISPGHWAVWLTALCLTGSVIARSFLFSGESLWLYLILPTLASVLYTVTVVCAGEEMLFKTAVPVWITGICAIARFWYFDSNLLSWGFVGLCILFFSHVYTS